MNKARPMTRQWKRNRHGRVEMAPHTVPYPAMCTFPFPLRGGVMAQFVLPLDMTRAEANRMIRYIESLTIPENQ